MQSITAAQGGSRVGVIDQLTASGVFHVGRGVNALPAAGSTPVHRPGRDHASHLPAQHREFLEI